MSEYFAYVLGDDAGRRYKGCTNNLRRRLQEHKSGKTITTRKMINPRLIYYEKYPSFEEARKRELYFKTAAGRRFLDKQILGR